MGVLVLGINAGNFTRSAGYGILFSESEVWYMPSAVIDRQEKVTGSTRRVSLNHAANALSMFHRVPARFIGAQLRRGVSMCTDRYVFQAKAGETPEYVSILPSMAHHN